MQKKERSVPANKTAQAAACLSDAEKALVARDRSEAELALKEYIDCHREGLRAGELTVMDPRALQVCSLLIGLAHRGCL